MISDFLCVCQLPSRFTTQCHASTCHVVCGYMHWDGAYSLTLHLEVSGTPGRRDRLPYLRSNSKQSCRRPIQVTLRNALHDIMTLLTLQIFRSKSWLPHLALIFALVKSPSLESLWISQLFSYFSRHFQSSQNIDCLSCSCTGPFALGCCHTARELSLREARNWWKLQVTCKLLQQDGNTYQCIASASLVFLDDSAAWLELRWLHTKCQRMSKTRYTKEKYSWRMRPESQKSRYGMVWIHIIIIHNTYCAYHFLPLWQPFCLSDSFWPARALDLMLAASAALRRQNVRPQKVERRHIASSKCKRKKGRM